MSRGPSQDEIAAVMLVIAKRSCDVCGAAPCAESGPFAAHVREGPDGKPEVLSVTCLQCVEAAHKEKILEN